MSTLGKAVVIFGADTVLFRGDVGRAVAIFESGIGRMQRVALGFKSAIAGSLTIGGTLAFTQSVIDAADELAKLSDKTGRQVEALSALKLAYELGGGPQEGFAKGLKGFNESLVEATNNTTRAARLFAALGVDIKAGPTEAFRQFADAFAKLPEGELRTAAATEILKKAGEGWIPVLQKGAAGIDEVAERGRRLGLIVSTDFARQAEQFNDNMKLLRMGSIAFANAILTGVAPAMVDLSQRMALAAERGEKLRELWEIAKQVNAMSLPASDPKSGAPLNANERYVEAMVQGRFASGRIRQPIPNMIDAELRAGAPVPDPEAVRRALADTEALQKRQMLALQQMEEKRKALFGLNEKEIMEERVKTGSYKEFDIQTKTRLLNLAAEIDYRAELIDRIDAETAAVMVSVQAREHGGEIFRDFVLTGKANLEQIQFETDLLGRSAREQEKLTALRQIDLDLRSRIRQVAQAYGDDEAGAAQEVARLEAQAQKQREAAIAGITRRQEVERHWSTGAKIALNDYAEAATSAAKNTEMVFSSAFRNLEDQSVSFLRRGKWSLSNFSDALADDVARALTRQFVTGPLAAALGSLFGGAGGFSLLDVQAATLGESFVSLDATMTTFDAAVLNATAALETFAASAAGGSAANGAGGLAALFGGAGAGAGGGAIVGGGFEELAASAAFLAANGGIMTSRGPLALRSYDRGGIANRPQLAIFGEGRMPEAYVPLPDGKRIPVHVTGAGRGGDTYYIDARGADREGLDQLARTIQELQGSVAFRAVAAVNAAQRRGALRR